MQFMLNINLNRKTETVHRVKITTKPIPFFVGDVSILLKDDNHQRKKLKNHGVKLSQKLI